MGLVDENYLDLFHFGDLIPSSSWEKIRAQSRFNTPSGSAEMYTITLQHKEICHVTKHGFNPFLEFLISTKWNKCKNDYFCIIPKLAIIQRGAFAEM